MNVQAFVGAKLLSSGLVQPSTKPFEIYDTRLPGFTLRVQPAAFRRALISASENTWISRSKTKRERFLRLPCAYGDEAISASIGITLI
jgi:hypothetical protein